MSKPTITVHALKYKKADLDKAPEDHRLLFILLTGLSNDVLMLNKALTVILASDPPDAPTIVNQANSAYAMLMLRMLCGRLREGYKLISQFSKVLKADYEPHLDTKCQIAFKEIHKYFNVRGKNALVQRVRDTIAFHNLSSEAALAYEAVDSTEVLGDYIHETMGNTLYYTAEILHYQALQNLSGAADSASALTAVWNDASMLTTHVNDAVNGFALAFAKLYLADAVDELANEKNTFEVNRFSDLKLSFFSTMPA